MGIDDKKRIEFLTAAKDGNLKRLQEIYDENPEILTVKSTTDQYNALHYASGNGFLDCVHFLIEKKLDRNIRSRSDKRAIDLARQCKYVEVFQYLASLECSSDALCPITQEPRSNLNQIWFPTCCGDKGNFVSLLDFIRCLKLNDLDRCPCCNSLGIREKIRESGYQVPDAELIRNFSGYVERGELRNVRRCIVSGCAVNATKDEEQFINFSGCAFLPQHSSPLLNTAILYGQYDCFLFLLEQDDIDVNKPDQKGNTPLLCAVEKVFCGRDQRFFDKLVIHSKIDFNKHNKEFVTPLATAAQYGLTYCVRKLIELGGDKILLNAEGLEDTTTALYYACQKGFEGVVDELLKCPDIDVTKATPDGSCPLTIAVSEVKDGIAFKLLSHPRIDVNQRSGRGDTALILAVSRYILNRDLILELLNKGADSTIKAPDGATAISVLIGTHERYRSEEERKKQRRIKVEILEILESKCSTKPRPH